MTESFKMDLSMEHLNKDLVDIPVEVLVEVYQGSAEGLSSDDPSEIEILKITILEKFEYFENKVKFTLYPQDEIKVIDSKTEDNVIAYYESKN